MFQLNRQQKMIYLTNLYNEHMPRNSIPSINNEIVKCRRCPRLVEWLDDIKTNRKTSYSNYDYWSKPVPGFGDTNASILIIGLAPGAHGANRTGRVFTGDTAGVVLYKALYDAGLCDIENPQDRNDTMSLKNVYITNMVKCAPPENKPTAKERRECSVFLDSELSVLNNIKVFVALGGLAANALSSHMKMSPKPKFEHGKHITLPDDKNMIFSYHPSQYNLFTGRITQQMMNDVINNALSLAKMI